MIKGGISKRCPLFIPTKGDAPCVRGESSAAGAARMRPPFSFPRKKTGVARPKERRFPLQASSSKSCNACRLHCPVRGVAIRFDLLLSSAVAQPLAALLPYGCGTPLAGAALESERKCSVITCYRWHNIAASAAKPPRQAVCRPMRRHTRLTIVRRGCKTVTKRTDSWRSHVHRT